MPDSVPIPVTTISPVYKLLPDRRKETRLASDVSAVGKTIIITGCNRGIGRSTALDLARRGASIIMACRNMKDASKVADEIKSETGNQNINVIQLDLASFTSIKAAVQEINKKYEKIDVLINNAGLIGSEDKKMTEDGNEIHFQTNHLGPFLLTVLLLPKLRASSPSRIVNVSSDRHRMNRSIDLDDLNFSKNYSPYTSYCVTKLENILFTNYLASRLRDSGVTVNCLNPGATETLLLKNPIFSDFFHHWCGPMKSLLLKSEEEGAQTSIYCALEPSLNNISGRYFENCREREVSNLASNPELANQLWDKSIAMTAKYLRLDDTEKVDFWINLMFKF